VGAASQPTVASAGKVKLAVPTPAVIPPAKLAPAPPASPALERSCRHCLHCKIVIINHSVAYQRQLHDCAAGHWDVPVSPETFYQRASRNRAKARLCPAFSPGLATSLHVV